MLRSLIGAAAVADGGRAVLLRVAPGQRRMGLRVTHERAGEWGKYTPARPAPE